MEEFKPEMDGNKILWSDQQCSKLSLIFIYCWTLVLDFVDNFFFGNYFVDNLVFNHMMFGKLSSYTFMSGRIHTLITSGFSNVGTSQLIVNMIGPTTLEPASQEPWDRSTF